MSTTPPHHRTDEPEYPLGKVGRGRGAVLKTSLADRAMTMRATLNEKSEA